MLWKKQKLPTTQVILLPTLSQHNLEKYNNNKTPHKNIQSY